jgi:hypothetical protein
MTRNTFVFGIGGTGARVIRAMTMLLAAGTELAHDGKIIPVIIDVDAENEDTSRTIKALDLYKKIRAGAYGDNSEKKPGFFGTSLNTLSSQRSSEGDKIRDEFQLKFAGISSSFASYLKFADMEGIDNEFMKLLYDASPKDKPEAELNLELTKGFKGNPNIGCIIFNELENSPEFKYFLSAIGEHDRIFIVSSIFGGTGSAGFPQLLKLLKGNRNNHVSSARTGAVTIMPYFSVQEDKGSAIDSTRFISKTKAALSYYEHEMESLDSMYYIYDKPGSTPYENNEGGRAQRNNAHVVELIAATALINFTNRPDAAFDGKTQYYEYGIKRNESTLNLSHFFEETRRSVLRPLTAFTYAAKAWTEFVPGQLKEAFAQDLELDKSLTTNAFYQVLTAFIKEHYIPWLKEMGVNNRTFKPFDLDADFNSLVQGKPIKTGLFSKGISEGYLKEHFGKIQNRLKATIAKPETRTMMLLSEVAEKCFEKLEDMPAIA